VKRVLFIGLVWPEPTSSAAGWRILQLIKLFQQQYEVHFASSASKSEYSYPLSDLGITEHTILLNDSSFDYFIQDLRPDIVIFDRFMIEEQYGWRVTRSCPQTVQILDTEDLHLLRAARLEAYKKDRPIDLYNDTALREIASIYRCDLSLVISEAEMQLLTEEFHIHEQLIYFLPFCEEAITSAHISALPSFEARKDFVFIGNFIHEPNWKTVEILKRDIWPRIRKELPQAKLHIYGAYTPPKALQLHQLREGFLIKGRAEDARSTLAQYRVLLAPIPVGAGMKGKFVDAMHGGIPVVSSTIGAEGMAKEGLWNGFIADDIVDFVQKSLALYNHKEEWIQAQANGFTLFNKTFADLRPSFDLLEKCHDLCQNLENHRRKNFIGRMLRHHTLQSTKYLSLWIEEKNKGAH